MPNINRLLLVPDLTREVEIQWTLSFHRCVKPGAWEVQLNEAIGEGRAFLLHREYWDEPTAYERGAALVDDYDELRSARPPKGPDLLLERIAKCWPGVLPF